MSARTAAAWAPFDPSQVRDCRRLFVRDLALQARIGAYDAERAAPQRIVVNIDVWVPLADSLPQADALAEIVDYDFIRDLVHARVARGHIVLQETLADYVLRALLAHPAVRAARVRTEKAEIYADAAAVGVEVAGMRAST